MEIRTLVGVNSNAVMEAFNQGFSDYVVPVQLTAEQWNSKTQSENVQWDLSVGAFDNEKLVGFILHGSKIRNGEQWIYNGGTAVIPSHRGQQLTQKMYAYIQPILKTKSISKVLLEVIDNNQPAIKSYETIGFKNTRRLLCFKGNYETKTADNSSNIKTLETLDWNQLKLFWDINPSWQNDIEAIMLIQPNVKAIGIYREEILAGYLIYNPISNKILQLAVHPEFRQKGFATALLHFAFQNTDKPVLITNIEDCAVDTVSFFKHLGLENMITQNEMELKL